MDELIELYGDEFYDSPHLVSRKRIDNIADVPVLDDDGKEKLIYNIDGYRVVRRYPLIPDNDVTYCGILCNFDKCRELFIEPDVMDFNDDPGFDDDMPMEGDDFDFTLDAVDVDDDDGLPDVRPSRRQPKRDVTFRTFPAAFIHHMGQIQADGPIIPIKRKVYAINHDTRLRPGIGPVISCGAQQMYTSFAHYMRESARQHIAQRGILTGASAGAYAHNPATQSIASSIYNAVSAALPHTAIDYQMSSGKESFLRSENIFTINVHRLRNAIRNGGDFFGSVIEPLLGVCTHSDVCKALKESSVILRPEVCSFRFGLCSISCSHFLAQVFPKLYLWTSVPITILIEEVWAHYIKPVLQERQAVIANNGTSSRSTREPPIAQLGLVPEPQWVEFMSMLERCLNYCHTGNAICVSNQLMKDSFTMRAILNGCLPLLANVIDFNIVDGTIPMLPLSSWPVDKKGYPLAISRRAIQLTYGDSQWAVSSRFSQFSFFSVLVFLSYVYPPRFALSVQ